MRARESEQLLEIKAALRSEQLQLHEELRQELRSEQLQLHEELRRQLRREASWASPTVDSHQWTPTQGNSPFWERPDQSGCEAIPEGQQELAASGGPSPPPSPPTIISRTRFHLAIRKKRVSNPSAGQSSDAKMIRHLWAREADAAVEIQAPPYSPACHPTASPLQACRHPCRAACGTCRSSSEAPA